MIIVDRTYLEIDGEIVPCTTLDEDIDPTMNPVEAMTKDNLILGYAYGNPKIRLTAEVPMDAESDVDFDAMVLGKTQFSAAIEYEGGGSKTYVDCVIAKYTVRSRQGQQVTYSLDMHARGFVKN